METLQNTLGFLCSIFFIAMCLISLENLQCIKHPNGKLTLRIDRSVVCWESSEHTELAVLSTIAVLIYPVFFLALTGFLTLKYHQLAHRYGLTFLKRTRFLHNRMDPMRYQFGFALNLRGFVLTLVPVVLANSFGMQTFVMTAIFVCWLLMPRLCQTVSRPPGDN